MFAATAPRGALIRYLPHPRSPPEQGALTGVLRSNMMGGNIIRQPVIPVRRGSRDRPILVIGGLQG